MEIQITNLESKIITDNPELLKVLIDKYSFKMPGYQYIASYKNGYWDGSKKFISPKGVFKTGLLSSILTDLSEIGCKPKLNKEKFSPIIPAIQTPGDVAKFKLYDYQTDLVRKALANFRGVIKSPTGSGKTLILASVITAIRREHPDAKITVLFNSKQILTQTYEFLAKECGIPSVGICFGEGHIDGDIMLCSVMSISKILDTHLEKSLALLVDEAHEFAAGKVLVAAISSFPNAIYRLGLTATPPTDNIKKCNLEGALGPVIESVSTKDLTASGVLTPAKIQFLELPDLSGTEDMSYPEVYEDYIVSYETRNDLILEVVNSINQNNSKARVMILTKNLKHGELLSEKLKGNRVFYLQGENSISERYEAIDSFRRARGNSILIGTNILQTGVNIKEITHLIIARGLKSEVATLQAIGRALRSHESKQIVYIYDFIDKGKYLSNHSKKRYEHYKTEGHEIKIIKNEKN